MRRNFGETNISYPLIRTQIGKECFNQMHVTTQQAVTCSKSTLETREQCVKSVQI